MYNLIFTETFLKDVKFYQKKKRYTHILDDIEDTKKELEKGNFIGDEIPGLGIESDGHTYKVRAANTDTNVGKSNGYRIIYYAVRDDNNVYMLTIYSKKDKDRIPSNKEIIQLVIDNCL